MNNCHDLKSALRTFLDNDFGVVTPYNMDSTACQSITSNGGPEFKLKKHPQNTVYFRFKCGATIDNGDTTQPDTATNKAADSCQAKGTSIGRRLFGTAEVTRRL